MSESPEMSQGGFQYILITMCHFLLHRSLDPLEMAPPLMLVALETTSTPVVFKIILHCREDGSSACKSAAAYK